MWFHMGWVSTKLVFVFGIHLSVLMFVYFYRLVFALALGLSWCIHVRGIVHPEPDPEPRIF